jgi:hypothetical protein
MTSNAQQAVAHCLDILEFSISEADREIGHANGRLGEAIFANLKSRTKELRQAIKDCSHVRAAVEVCEVRF